MGGGGGGGTTITMPDTGKYDRMYDRQMQMMQMAQSSELTDLQASLTSAQSAQEDLLEKLVDVRTERAENVASVEAEARRMSNIIGAPPPEASAAAPVTGAARTQNKRANERPAGKRGLRIGRQVASTAGSGAGLNII
jgi:hypothetical protein